MIRFLIVLFFVNSCFAGRLTDGKVKTTVKENSVTIEIEKGFHINEKAPMTFKFYVCDDKNTVCEQQEIKPALKK